MRNDLISSYGCGRRAAEHLISSTHKSCYVFIHNKRVLYKEDLTKPVPLHVRTQPIFSKMKTCLVLGDVSVNSIGGQLRPSI